MTKIQENGDINIELRDIRKNYGPVKANDGVCLKIKKGSIHGVLGENGAGKSTLMKIMAGYVSKTSGVILANGKEVDFKNPAAAAAVGVGMLYQDPLDFPSLTVLENFMLGQPRPKKKRAPDKKDYLKRLRRAAAKFNFRIDPEAHVRDLTIGQRHQLEIARLLERGVKILILDEPTTGISNEQKETLFNALRKLASEQKSVVLVSHKLEDVQTLCDSITVLRCGKVTGNIQRPFETDAIFEMMFQTKPQPLRPPDVNPGRTLLEFKHLSASGGAGLKDCDFSMRRGEIVGLAGLEGSGQSVFLRVAAGMASPRGGSIFLRGKKMERKNLHDFQKRGVAFLPDDRLGEALIPPFTIAEHFILKRKRGFFLKQKEACAKAQEKIDEFSIKGGPDTLAKELSGGNQQRLIMSFLPKNPSLLLLDNPTRGLDPESARMVWEYLKEYSRNGSGIIFSSPEIDEILMAANRALVFFDGAVVKDVQTRDTDINEIGRAIAGDMEYNADY